MKIDTIGYTQKFNLGNYESAEVSFSAALEDGESAVDALYNLKQLAQNFMATSSKPTGIDSEQAIKVKEEAKEVEAPKKAKKVKAAPVEDKKHGDIMDGQEVPPVIPSEAQEEMETVESPFQLPKDAIAYDLKNKDHRDRFAAYLTKTFPNWKTKPKEQLLAMSQELSGKAFEDKKGVMLDSFKNIVASFFE